MAKGEVRYKLIADTKDFKEAVAGIEESIHHTIEALGLFEAFEWGKEAAERLFELTKESIEFGEHIQKAAEKTGLSTDALQTLSVVSKAAGTDLDSINSAFGKLEVGLYSGKAKAAIEALGLSFEEMRNAAPDEILERVVAAADKLDSPIAKAGILKDLFGKGYQSMLPVLEVYEKIKQVSDEWKLDEGQIASLDELGDAAAVAREAFDGLSHQIAAGIASSESLRTLIDGLTHIFADWAKQVRGNQGDIRSWVDDGVLLAAKALVGLMDVIQEGDNVLTLLKVGIRAAEASILNMAAAVLKYGEITSKIFMGSIVSDWFKEQRADVEGLSSALQDQAREEIDDSAKRADSIGKVRASFVALEESVRKSAGAHVEATTAARGHGAALEMTAEESKKAAQAQKEMADVIQKLRNDEAREAGDLYKRMVADASAAARAMADAWIKEAKEQEDAQEQAAKGMEKMADEMGAALRRLHDQALEKIISGLRSLGSTLLQVGSQTPGLFGSMATAAGGYANVVANLNDKTVQQASTFTKLSGAIQGAMTAYKSGVIGGAAAGAQAGASFGAWGAAIGAVGGAIMGLVGKLGIFGDKAIMETNRARDSFFAAEGGFEAFSKKMAAVSSEDWAKKIFDAKSVDEFNKLVAEAKGLLDNQTQAEADLQKAMEKYGITIDEMGPKWKQQELDKQAGDLLKDYQLLIASGVDVNTVIAKMGPNMNEYVQTALKAGVAIPESMRPVIEKMIEQGQLLDENGKAYTSTTDAGITFAKTQTEALNATLDAVNKLVEAIERMSGIHVDPIHIPVTYDPTNSPYGGGGGGGHNDQAPEDVPHYATGVSSVPYGPYAGGASLAVLHPGETVIPSGGGGIAAALRALAASNADLDRRIARAVRDAMLLTVAA